MGCFGIISLDRPAIVCKHGGIPLALITNFLGANGLLNGSAPLLVTQITLKQPSLENVSLQTCSFSNDKLVV